MMIAHTFTPSHNLLFGVPSPDLISSSSSSPIKTTNLSLLFPDEMLEHFPEQFSSLFRALPPLLSSFKFGGKSKALTQNQLSKIVREFMRVKKREEERKKGSQEEKEGDGVSGLSFFFLNLIFQKN